MCGGSGWAGCRGPGPRAGTSRPAPPPGRVQPPPLPLASDPPRPRPGARPGPSPAAPSRASQSPPRGAGGRAATPSGSLPRLRASHTSLHSAHSRRPPCKLEARGWEGRSSRLCRPPPPHPGQVSGARRAAPAPRGTLPTVRPPLPRRVLPSGRSFLAAVRLPALDSGAAGALLLPLSSLLARARSSLPSPRFLPSVRSPRPRQSPRVPFLSRLTHSARNWDPRVFPAVPFWENSSLRALRSAHRDRQLRAGLGRLGVGRSRRPTFPPPSPRHSARAPRSAGLTPCRPCSAVARLLGRSRASAGRVGALGEVAATGGTRPPHLPHPGTGSHQVAKAGLQLSILLPQLPKHLGLQANIGPAGAPPSRALEGKAGTITSNEWSSPNSPEGSSVSGGSQALDKPIDNDAEGVWSPDIEQSFQEALAIYPPCGRRKIILSDEGKMYGRNELIARYIKLRTGKTRTRKQVSSHIQVLARRKAREIQAKLKDQAAKDKALQSMAAMSSAQIISATAFHSKMALTRGPGYPAVSGFWQGALPGQAGTSHDVKPFSQQTYTVQPPLPLPGFESPAGPTPSPSAPPAPPWQGRSVASSKLWMLEFSAFLEQQQDPDTYNKHLFVHIGQSSPSYSDPYLEAVDIRQIYDKFPEKKGGLKELFERGPSNAFFLVKFWADLNTNIEDEGSSFYGVSSQYESPENMIITCSTKVCSFGKQVVEKVETEYARYENGHYSYRIHRSPLCEYMINFIHKLKHLPEKYMMNSVLENFTILQVVTNRDTQETLLCIAYVFEVSASEHGAQHHIYRLVKE